MNDNINAREVDILREAKPDNLVEFIEKNGARLRSLIEEHEEHTNQEIIELLKSGYSSL